MTITVTITDPNEKDKPGLLALSDYLRALAGADAAPVAIQTATTVVTVPDAPKPARSTAAAGPTPNAPVAAPDVPLPPSIEPSPSAVFGGATTPVPPAPLAAATSVSVDSAGLPWDGRIHAESKSQIADGSWRKKRGVDPELVTTVEAELRATMAAPAPVASAAVPAPPVMTAPAATGITYPLLIAKITSAMTAGTLTQTDVQAALASVGIAALPLLAARPDLVSSVDAALSATMGDTPQ